jgi:hypothetical protein
MTFWQMFYSVGSFIAYWIGYAVTPHADTLGYTITLLFTHG